MASYKLIYFDLRGKAEIIRLIFAASGEKYQDFRIPFDFEAFRNREIKEWNELKPTMPFGQVPVLEVTECNGRTTKIAQSMAIARYLARKFNLAGKDELEQAFVDMFVDQISDVGNEISKFFRIQDSYVKRTAQENFMSCILPPNLDYFERQLSSTNSGFLVGQALTWADIWLVVLFDWIKDHVCQDKGFLDEFPLVKKHQHNIRASCGIKEWIEARPKTPF